MKHSPSVGECTGGMGEPSFPLLIHTPDSCGMQLMINLIFD